MSITEQQKAYLLVPWLMAEQLAEYGRLIERQTDSAYSGFVDPKTLA